MFNFYIKFVNIYNVSIFPNKRIFAYSNQVLKIKNNSKKLFFYHVDEYIHTEKKEMSEKLFAFNNEVKNNLNEYKKISFLNKHNEFTVINPEINWYEKIKNTKKNLHSYLMVKNKFFKKFVKGFNIVQYINYNNNIFDFVNKIDKSDTNFLNMKKFTINGKSIKSHNQIFKTGDVISKEVFVNDFYNTFDHLNSVNINYINFEINFLTMSFFYVLKLRNAAYDHPINVLNFKSYCWKTKKKFY